MNKDAEAMSTAITVIALTRRIIGDSTGQRVRMPARFLLRSERSIRKKDA
jgi:hypothetical protein